MSHSPQLVLLPGLAADERMWRGVLPLLPSTSPLCRASSACNVARSGVPGA